MKLFDVLKAGAGLPVEDSFAALWGQQMAGTSFVTEMQGAPPLQIVSAGKPLTAYRIYGNSVQDGTPSPENPIEVQSVGDKTKNLFDKNDATVIGHINSSGGVNTNRTNWRTTKNFISCSDKISVQAKNGLGTGGYIACYDSNKALLGSIMQSNSNATTGTIQLIEGTEYIKTCCRQENLGSYQIELGSEVTAYEPYGYKIPVVVSGENHEPITTNIYLDEQLRKIGDYADVIDFERGVVERKIKKIVFDGSENFFLDSNKTVFVMLIDEVGAFRNSNPPILSSHYQTASEYFDLFEGKVDYGISFGTYKADRICIRNKDITTVEGFNEYLKEQYNAGTPVTVYYALAEPTTEQISIPSIPTFDGTTVITVDTKIQPPNMYVKYNGKR